MYHRSTQPAEQLASVSGRYRVAKPWRQAPPRQRFSATVLTRRAAVATETPDGERDERMRRLEAVLVLAREPLSSRKLAQYSNLADGTEARTLIRRLNQLYDRLGRSFRVEEVAGGFQLLTRRKFAAWLRRLEHVPPETRLSAPALETLAVIAYRQPVPRADIEAIRGVNCGEILRQLMERDLVRIGSRSEELGRPFLYATTKRFLQVFGLVSLEDLPQAAAIRALPVTAMPPLPVEPNDPAEEETSADQDELEYTGDQA